MIDITKPVMEMSHHSLFAIRSNYTHQMDIERFVSRE